MGTELGYIKASELKGIAEYAAMYAEIFMKTIPQLVSIYFLLMLCTACYAERMTLVEPTCSPFPLTSDDAKADFQHRQRVLCSLHLHGQQILRADRIWLPPEGCHGWHLCSWSKGRA